MSNKKMWKFKLRPLPSHRHPGDLIRLLFGIVSFIVLTLMAFTRTVGPFEEYIFRATNALPGFLTQFLEVLMQAGALFFVPIAAGFALLQRHKRLPIKLLLGGSMTWVVAKYAKAFVNRDRPAGLLEDFIARNITTTEFGFPSGHAAVAACLATVVGPYLPKRWRLPVWVLAWLVALARVYVGVHLPLDVFAGLAMGWVIGSGTNLLFGTPDQPIPMSAIKAKLKDAGFGVLNIKRANVDARGSMPLFAKKGNREYFVKFVSHEHRNADLIYKAWRYFILREVEDEAPFARALQLVEHEAYLLEKARGANVRTPKVALAAPVTPRAAMLVTEKIDGVELSKFDRPISDALLNDIWQEVKKLHEAHIAHRDLRAANVMIDGRLRPWLIDFSFAETAIESRITNFDIVEMLVSLGNLVGPKRAVNSSVKVLGKSTVHSVSGQIQPLILSSCTRKSIRSHPELLDAIRQEITKSDGSALEQNAPLRRFRLRTIVWAVTFILILLLLIQKHEELHGMYEHLQRAKLEWLFAAGFASLATYIASGIVMLGASPIALPFGKVFLLQFASTAANRVTPKGLGAVAVTERFLNKKGFTHIEALSTISLIYFFGVIIHLGLTAAAFAILNKPIHLFDVDITDTQWFLIGVISVLTLAGISYLPRARYGIKKALHSAKLNILHGFQHPMSLLQLSMGSAFITIFNALALYFSLFSVDASVSFQVVFFVYLTASSVASVAPTPGGLGATEAALITGLTLFDINLGSSVAAVLLFRLMTFWLPTLPGVLALKRLQKQQLI